MTSNIGRCPVQYPALFGADIEKPSVPLYLIHAKEGEDLVEYALVVAMIAFAATVGMKSLAAILASAFKGIARHSEAT